MALITLKSCPKVYIHETHRSKQPGDTLKFVEGMRNLLGMKDFREATELDRLGIPVFTCWRLRPDESKTFHTGKGASAIQAQVSITMESIERYSSEFHEEWADRLIVGSFNSLRKKAQHPRSHGADPLAVQRIRSRQGPALGRGARHRKRRRDPRPRKRGLPPLPPRRRASLRFPHKRARVGQHHRGGCLPRPHGDCRAGRLEYRQTQP